MESEEFDEAVADLEIRLERLRSLYEQYFLGIERIEPTVARKDVDRRFWQLRKVKLRNTARRFKLQNLVSRYNTLQQHWMKVCRQIENGTYIRHLARAQRRFAPEPTRRDPASSTATEEGAWAADDGPTPEQVRRAFSALASSEPTRAAPAPAAADRASTPAPAAADRAPAPAARDRDSAEPPSQSQPSLTARRPPPLRRRGGSLARAPAAPAQPQGRPDPTAARPREHTSPATGVSGLSDDAIRQLHHELVRQRAIYEPSSKSVSATALAQSLRATEAKLKAKHGAKRVEFRVEQKSGRVIIKPTVHR